MLLKTPPDLLLVQRLLGVWPEVWRQEELGLGKQYLISLIIRDSQGQEGAWPQERLVCLKNPREALYLVMLDFGLLKQALLLPVRRLMRLLSLIRSAPLLAALCLVWALSLVA